MASLISNERNSKHPGLNLLPGLSVKMKKGYIKVIVTIATLSGQSVQGRNQSVILKPVTGLPRSVTLAISRWTQSDRFPGTQKPSSFAKTRKLTTCSDAKLRVSGKSI